MGSLGTVPQDQPYDLLSEAFWLLTTGTDTRRNPPGLVRAASALAALCDLERHRFITWSGQAEASEIRLGASSCVGEELLQRWYDDLADVASDGALAARFTVDPLLSAWHDTADRLVAAGHAVTHPSVLPGRGPAFSVSDPAHVKTLRHDLEQAVRRRTTQPWEALLVAIAWTGGCFDDLFRIHGLAVDADLDERARELVGDAETNPTLAELTDRLSAAVAYRGGLGTDPSTVVW